MLILIDKKASADVKIKLSNYGEVIDFETNSIVYKAISGHPDIFFCQASDKLIIAPNTPKFYMDLFTQRNINFIIGKNILESKYPRTAYYNALVSNSYLIHNLKYSDNQIKEAHQDKIHLHVNQAYTRCNLIAISESKFITSDRGIFKELSLNSLISVLYVNPEQIILPGFKNGFFGGCCGLYKNNLFINGSLDFIDNKHEIKYYLSEAHINLIELSNNKLFDIGSILFLEEH